MKKMNIYMISGLAIIGIATTIYFLTRGKEKSNIEKS
jgi:hypothetical protein